MYLLYNAFLVVLALVTLPGIVFALWWRPRYRDGMGQRLGYLPGAVRDKLKGRPCLWIHAPSVGEVLAIIPFLHQLKSRYPDRGLLLSTLTATGQQIIRRQFPQADAVIYFPVDFPGIPDKVLEQVRPQAFLFTETEIWPNFLRAAARRNIPTILVSGRVSPTSLRWYKVFRPFFGQILGQVTFCCMQSPGDAQRIIAGGARPERVAVTGSFKLAATEHHRSDAWWLKETGRPIIAAGSTHTGEEAVVLRAFARLRHHVANLLLLLAPRHLERIPEVEDLLVRGGYAYARRSGLGASVPAHLQVILLDNMGELPSLYAGVSVAFVGGSMVDRGGHNIVEPAAAGIPVLFGPFVRNLATVAEELQRAGGGRMIRDEEELYRELRRLLTDSGAARSMGHAARRVITGHRGVIERTLEMTAPFLSA